MAQCLLTSQVKQVRMRTLSDSALSVSVYPEFEYDASGKLHEGMIQWDYKTTSWRTCLHFSKSSASCESLSCMAAYCMLVKFQAIICH